MAEDDRPIIRTNDETDKIVLAVEGESQNHVVRLQRSTTVQLMYRTSVLVNKA